MRPGFVVFKLEVSAVFAVTHLDREGGFAEVMVGQFPTIIAQTGIACAREMRFFGLKISRAGLAPFEACELVDLGFIAIEAFHAADFRDDSGRQNRAQS